MSAMHAFCVPDERRHFKTVKNTLVSQATSPNRKGLGFKVFSPGLGVDHHEGDVAPHVQGENDFCISAMHALSVSDKRCQFKTKKKHLNFISKTLLVDRRCDLRLKCLNFNVHFSYAKMGQGGCK